MLEGMKSFGSSALGTLKNTPSNMLWSLQQPVKQTYNVLSTTYGAAKGHPYYTLAITAGLLALPLINKFFSGQDSKGQEIVLNSVTVEKIGTRQVLTYKLTQDKTARKTRTFFENSNGRLYNNESRTTLAYKALGRIPAIFAYSLGQSYGNVASTAYKTVAALRHPGRIFTKDNVKGMGAQLFSIVKPALSGAWMIGTSAASLAMPLKGRVWTEKAARWGHEDADHTNFKDLRPRELLRGNQSWYLTSNLLAVGDRADKGTIANVTGGEKKQDDFNIWNEVVKRKMTQVKEGTDKPKEA